MLTINNIEVTYLDVIRVLHGVSMAVEDGSIVALLGANGAGKSTTLKAIAGLVKARNGEIIFQNENILGKDTIDIVARGITMVPEGRKVFVNLSVLENLRVGAYLRRDGIEDDIKRVYDLFPILKARAWQLAGTLSGGEQQMLAVGRALMARPNLIMMDEPSLGLAPLIVNSIFEIIKEINKQGTTILLIEQNANKALKVADYGYVLETGNITMEGKGIELLKNEKIIEAYLGTSKK